MEEVDSLRAKLFPEDSVSLAPSTAESIVLEDAHYAALRTELEGDAQDLEAESWSTAVEQPYLKNLSKEAVKRQDVIYELIQTELNHVRTLKLLLRVYMHELRGSLQLEEARLDRLFPWVLGDLLRLHQDLLARLKLRRQQALEPDSTCNYCIAQLGDVLISQFSGERGDRMKECYGVFCSHQGDAVSLYKEQLQNNKKFQQLIRKIGQLSIVRRLGVPECILLVTQRITKYPVLVERIIQNTEDAEERESLAEALGLIKDTISQVDAHVDEYDKMARLKEIGSRLEPKSQGRLKDGRLFRREDVARRTLLHEGTVTLKTASSRLKDIHAVLLSDVLLLLYEKDQKFTFVVADNKPSVISLQNLIVREVALEDRAMFLICATTTVMYEIRARTREERDTWMTLIREAVESCPEMEEELYSEQEEARVARLRDFQERLWEKDAQIVQSLTEKLKIFVEFTEAAWTEQEDGASHPRLLLRGDTSDLYSGEQLLRGAITEVESLQSALVAHVQDSPHPEDGLAELGGLLVRDDTIAGFDSESSTTPVKNSCGEGEPASGDGSPVGSGQRSPSDPQLQDLNPSESQELSADEMPLCHWMSPCSTPFPESEILQSVLKLSQRLYSLQAVISQQDSHMELLRTLLSERERPARPRGSVLLEQEKQRNLEKQREEVANFHRLQAQHRQEQARWEKEVERHRLHAEAAEAELRHRGEECQRLEDQLAAEKEALQNQRDEYQQDLERLRESTRAVEKERERMEVQKKLKKNKTFSIAGRLNLDAKTQPLASSQSFKGDLITASDGDILLTSAARARPVLPVLSAGGLPEFPPEVPPRKESISPLPAKAEVPIHLVSTTNQAHKPGAVQQQIPTKLAALSKGKEKSSKAKGSHQRTHSAASIDMSQVVPIRVTGKEGGSLRAKKTGSPQIIYHFADRFNPPEPLSNVKPSQSISSQRRRSSQDLPPEPPPFPKDIPVQVAKPSQGPERVVFL